MSPTFSKSEMEVYSTPVNRTIQSALSQLQGLYPPGTGPRLNWAERSWHIPPYSNNSNIAENNFALPAGMQPIRVKTSQKVMVSDCPNYDVIVQDNLDKYADVVQEMNATYQPFLRRMTTLFNYTLPNNTFLGVLRLYDVVNVDKHLGRPFPPGFTDEDFDNLRHLANWYYLVTQLGDNIPMINSEKFTRLYEVFEARQKIPGSYQLKWTMLSGHDTDLVAMYLGLNISSFQCTEELYRKGSTSVLECQQGGNDFANNIIFELHSEDEHRFYVKVRVNGNYVSLCGKKATDCDYTIFKLYTSWNVIKNLEQICGKKITPY